ncbi:unnamed protein product [Allacma fusca]|uniref:Uncharacterized protein n=1 Tax=Allacma fusca TaxID=39272 RepID=A0A8J2PL62_9HEXA|nr:unnamed protein product [Allacma fusca]
MRCRADYASYPKTSAISEPMKLNIAFPPRVENLTGETRIRISKLKKMFNITLVAWANPFPTVKVNLQSKGESSPREITEFTSLSSVYVVEVINNFPSDQVTIFLRLLDSGRVKDEDKITVSVKNALGKEETTFIFVSDKTDIVDALYISLFIAIIILVLGILLIIVLVVVAPSRCRHTGFYQVNTSSLSL